MVFEVLFCILLLFLQISGLAFFREYNFLIILSFSALDTVLGYKYNLEDSERKQIGILSLVFLLLAGLSKIMGVFFIN